MVRHSLELGSAARISGRAAKLIRIKAKPRQSQSNAPEERFVSGDLMPMHPQSRPLKIRSALRWTVTVLALLFLVVTTVNAEIVTTSGHFAATGAVAISSVDCPILKTAAGRMPCQGTAFGIAGASHVLAAVSPTLGSSAWCYAAVIGCPIPALQRLLRPPQGCPFAC